MIYGAYTDFVSQRFCATALVAALDHRRRTGEGQHLDVAQFEAALQFLGPELLDHEVNGRVASRARQPRPPFRAPRRLPLPCRRGRVAAGERWLALACDRRRAVVGARRAAGLAGLGDRPGAGRRRPGAGRTRTSSTGAWPPWTAGRSAEELFAALQPRVAAAPVRAPGALLADPQLRHRVSRSSITR